MASLRGGCDGRCLGSGLALHYICRMALSRVLSRPQFPPAEWVLSQGPDSEFGDAGSLASCPISLNKGGHNLCTFCNDYGWAESTCLFRPCLLCLCPLSTSPSNALVFSPPHTWTGIPVTPCAVLCCKDLDQDPRQLNDCGLEPEAPERGAQGARRPTYSLCFPRGFPA